MIDTKINQEFSGEINGVIFDDKQKFYSAEYILETLEEYLTDITVELVTELCYSLGELWLKEEKFTYGDLEEELSCNINNGNIRLTYWDNEWNLEKTNAIIEKLKKD